MKHVVHVCKVGGKLKLIGEIASFANDFEGTHIPRGKLPFDTEATSTFHWRDAEVNMVSDLESQIMMLTIIVTLLARLRGFEIITNDFAHLSCLCDQVIGEIASFANDFEGTHIPRGKLPFDTEATSTFHWRDAEVNMVSDLESQIMMLTIIVTLLARLRGFEIITNDFAHLSCLCDQVIAKKLTFTSL